MDNLKYTLPNVLFKAGEIIARHERCAQFKIMGYGHVETHMRIHYADRDLVVTFTYNGEDPMDVTYKWSPYRDQLEGSPPNWVEEYNKIENTEEDDG